MFCLGHFRYSQLRGAIALLLVAYVPAFVFASGHGAEKPAAHGAKPAGHGAKPAGHGAEKKSGHGAPAGHGASGHGAEKKSGHGAAAAHGSGGHGAKPAGHGAVADKPAPPDPTYAPELAELLQLIDSKQKKNDPLKFVELDLGEYKLTHAGPGEGKMASVMFHLYAVVPEEKLGEVEEAMPAHEKRLRDTILSTVHEATYDDLNEPYMPTVKARLSGGINQVLNVVEVRDVVFSNLSTKLLH